MNAIFHEIACALFANGICTCTPRVAVSSIPTGTAYLCSCQAFVNVGEAHDCPLAVTTEVIA